MNRDRAADFIERLHRAQEDLYAGGDTGRVERLLVPDVVWHVPGDTPIAGRYEGRDAVIAYMLRRRELTERTFRMRRRELLVREGDHLAALTDGYAEIAGRAREWSTIGLYRLHGELLAECRLIPLDQAEFDSIWAAKAKP